MSTDDHIPLDGEDSEGGPAGFEGGASEGAVRDHELVIITGLSGAGRSEAIHTFEDLGYFCIDNLPPSFIRQLVDLTRLPGSRIKRIAVVCDVRGKAFFDELVGELAQLEEDGVRFHMLYLEADENVLVRRFKETRRKHPLAEEAGGVIEGIKAEREALESIRLRADLIVDSTNLTPRELRRTIKDRMFTDALASSLVVTVMSFGFKYGLPIDADIVMDVRFLPNPYYNPELRDLTGLDEPVRTFVMSRDETGAFLDGWRPLIATLAPHYLAEGKTHLTVALGCTGGQHRSVVLAEETAAHVRKLGYHVVVSHRDIGRDREKR